VDHVAREVLVVTGLTVTRTNNAVHRAPRFALDSKPLVCHDLCRGQRVIYTTPLKALSNQKLYEMRQRFGADMVGLQTGDASLNVQSSIVVMTTEVLRNIMYRTEASGSGGNTVTARVAMPSSPSMIGLHC
jgi:hypothetical protein